MNDVREQPNEAPVVLHPDAYFALQRGVLWCDEVADRQEWRLRKLDVKLAKRAIAAARAARNAFKKLLDVDAEREKQRFIDRVKREEAAKP